MSRHTPLRLPAFNPLQQESFDLEVEQPSPAPIKETLFDGCWLCFWLPHLALQVAGLPLHEPSAVIVTEKQRCVVYRASPAAEAIGVYADMPLAAALALCPELQTAPRDEHLETARRTKLVNWAYQFTSLISTRDEWLLLDIEGSLELFGGAHPLLQQTSDALNRWHPHQAAIAPTPLAAEWLAKHKASTVILDSEALRDVIGHLPITSLELSDKQIWNLGSIGINTLRQLFRLPLAEMGRRFGPELVQQLNRLLGKIPDVRHTQVPAPRYSDEVDIEYEVVATPRVLKLVTPLLERFVTYLQRRDLGVAHFTIELQHRKHDATQVRIGLQSVSRDLDRFTQLFKQHLEQYALPESTNHVRLLAYELDAYIPEAGSLALNQDVSSDDSHWWRVVEQVRARFGHTSVYKIELHDEHRPEYAWRRNTRLRPARRNTRKRTQHNHDTTACPRPLWLLKQSGETNPAHPRKVERIETGWWDGDDQRRDYYSHKRHPSQWRYRDLRTGQHYIHGLWG